MIRVLQVVTHMQRGGLETMLMNYYKSIDKTKIQFDFLVHRDVRADYDDQIEMMGGRIYRLPILNPFSIHYKRALNKFFREHSEYQIVHVHQDCMSSVILKEAAKNNIRVRIAHSHCASQDKNLKYPIKMFYQRQIPKYATKLIACGQEAGQWMFRGSEFLILNNAIDAGQYSYNVIKRIEMRKQMGIGEGQLLMGHVGRFSPQKNHLFLLDIFYNIQQHVDAKLILVGDGALRGEIEKKINELGLNKKIILTGVRNDVADLLQAMDIFVFPSNYEGFPVTMVEAQASGLPCLISDKVSIECKITEHVKQIPLDADIKLWTDNILEMSKYARGDCTNNIKREGYDIEENARWILEFYSKELKRENIN